MEKIELPDMEGEPLGVQTLYPDEEYWSTWSEAQKQKEREIQKRFSRENPDIVGITHTDADGYGCAVMLREAFPDQEDISIVTAAENGPEAQKYVGEWVADEISLDTTVFIMDLAPNEGDGWDFISPFVDFESIYVVDHHEWAESDADVIRNNATVHHDTEKCATQIMHDIFITDPNETITDLANLTADYDLWIREREIEGDALSDLATHTDIETYVRLAQNHGSDVINSEEGKEIISEAETKRKRETELAINRTTFHEVEELTVAITYGQCSPSDVGSELYEHHGADLACIVFPNGNVSLRSHEDTPIARDVALELDGGGHPCAAGGKIDEVGNSVKYTTFWATKGRFARDYLTSLIQSIEFESE